MGNVCERRSPSPRLRPIDKKAPAPENCKEVSATEDCSKGSRSGSVPAQYKQNHMCQRSAREESVDEVLQQKASTIAEEPEVTEDKQDAQECLAASAKSKGVDDVQGATTHNRAAFRALITAGEPDAIEVVLRIASNILKQPAELRFRSIRLSALNKRFGNAISDEHSSRAIAALQAADFVLVCKDGSPRLELDVHADLKPTRELVRMIERTRHVAWLPQESGKPVRESTPPLAWRLRVHPVGYGIEIPEEDAEVWSQTFSRTGLESKTWRGAATPKLLLTFLNYSSEPVTVSWLDSRKAGFSREESKGDIPAGGKYQNGTYVQHAWLLRDQSGRALVGYVPVEFAQKHHVVAVGPRSRLPSSEDFQVAALRLINSESHSAEEWHNSHQLNIARELPSRAASEQVHFLLWPSHAGRCVHEGQAELWASTFRGTGLEGRTWHGGQTQRLNVIFDAAYSDVPCRVSWINFQFQEDPGHSFVVMPGETREQNTCVQHAWVVRDANTGRALACYVPTDWEGGCHVFAWGVSTALPTVADFELRATRLAADRGIGVQM